MFCVFIISAAVITMSSTANATQLDISTPMSSLNSGEPADKALFWAEKYRNYINFMGSLPNTYQRHSRGLLACDICRS